MPKSVFTEKETAEFYAIRDDVKNNNPLENIIRKCEAIKVKNNFSYSYAAIMLAVYGRTNDALSLYDSGKCPGPFIAELFRYIRETGSIRPKVTVFKTTEAYDAWIKTTLYKTGLEGALKTIEKFISLNLPKEEVSIFDIGPGNGNMTAQIINKILGCSKIKKIKLVLLDKFPAMLELASKVCAENIKTELEIRTICKEAQDFKKEDLENFPTPFWLTICSRSIHHMPAEQKQPLLKFLRSITENCIIIENDANHDLPEKDSPEIVYSLNKSYGFIFADVNSSPITDREKKAAIDDFMLAEAIRILVEERKNRIDYHALSEEWAELSKKAGFKAPVVEAIAMESDNIVHNFAMILR